MTQPAIDPEVLAALLEGRLPADQRAAVVARLAASEPALDAYIDAVAAMSELEPGQMIGDRGRAKSPAGSGRWLSPRRWLALAAMLAGIGVVPWLATRMASNRTDPGRFVALLRAPAAGLPAGWDGRPWSSVRGVEQPVTASARATRLGARLVDLDLAVQARDTAAAALAGDIGALLEALPAAAPVTAMYRDIGQRAGAPPEELKPLLVQAGAAASQLAGPDRARFGAWVEAARIAAARGDTTFFRAAETRTALDRARGVAGLPEAARAIVPRLDSTLTLERAPDWSALERDLTALLGELAR